MNQKELINQVNLLKDYIKTLEQENQAKNNERQTIYHQLDNLSTQNNNLIGQLNYIKQQWENRQLYIRQMQGNFQLYRNDFENLNKTLIEKDSSIQNFRYQQQKDAQRIMWMQQILKEMKLKENKYKQQLTLLKQENKILSSKGQQNSQVWGNQQKINQLIQNYEKIQQIAKQKSHENQILRRENQLLLHQLYTYKNNLISKQKQLNNIKRNLHKRETQQSYKQKQNITFASKLKTKQDDSNINFTSNSNKFETKLFVKQQILNGINLIRQNNKLIQRITELEKQKNMIYAEVYQSIWRGEVAIEPSTLNPLRILTSVSNNTVRTNEGQKIRNKINQLKQENQILLQNLKI